jgi:hypothetical protein
MARRDPNNWRIMYSDPTDKQYERISGNFSLYYNRLLYAVGKRREFLTRDMLLDLHKKQRGLCAISGVPLTCNLKRGEICHTNAQIDQIKPQGGYTPDNIQLVCGIVNKMKWDNSEADLIWWCERIIENGRKKL